MEIETSIGKAAARVALKSHNNLWRETKKEEKKAFCVCLDFISSEVNLISQGDSKRVIIQISFKVAICQLHHHQPSLPPTYLMPPLLFPAAEHNETRA